MGRVAHQASGDFFGVRNITRPVMSRDKKERVDNYIIGPVGAMFL